MRHLQLNYLFASLHEYIQVFLLFTQNLHNSFSIKNTNKKCIPAVRVLLLATCDMKPPGLTGARNCLVPDPPIVTVLLVTLLFFPGALLGVKGFSVGSSSASSLRFASLSSRYLNARALV